MGFGLITFLSSFLGSVLLFSILNKELNRSITSRELKTLFQSQVLSITPPVPLEPLPYPVALILIKPVFSKTDSGL